MSSRNGLVLLAALVVAAAGLAPVTPASGTTYTWQGAVDNKWDIEGNWDQTPYPGSGDVATFGDSLTTTVDIDGTRSVGTVSFENTGGNYALTGSGVLSIETKLAQVSRDTTVSANISTSATDLEINVQAGTMSISGQVGGAAGINKTGGGNLTLSNNTNNYAGDTIISAGTLMLGNSGVLTDGTTLKASGGTLDIGSFNETVANVILTGGSITGGSGVLSSASGYDVQGGAISAKLAGGAVALTKTTGDTVTISGATTYTGGTNVSAGTLALGASNILDDTGTLTVTGGTFAMGAFNETVKLVSLQGGTISGTTGILQQTDANFDVQGGTISAILAGAGTGVSKTTADTVLLSGDNT
jgi:autotransporter-associated beta strand protein